MKQAAARTMIQLNWHQFARFDARYSVFFVTLNWKKNCFIPQISSDYWGIVIVLQKEYLRNFSAELNEIQWVKIVRVDLYNGKMDFIFLKLRTNLFKSY